jgi:hypothetical protein
MCHLFGLTAGNEKKLSFIHRQTYTHKHERWFWIVDVTAEGWTLSIEHTRKKQCLQEQCLQEQCVKEGTYGVPSLWNPQEKGLICL